jgi:hypothetical protein
VGAELDKLQMALTNLYEYSKIRKCSRQAVQKAVDSGRLKACIEYGANGKPYINDVALAHEEWDKNTASKHRPASVAEFTPPAAATAGKPKAQKSTPAKAKPAAKPKTPAVAQIPPAFEDPEESAIDPQSGLPRLHVSRQRQAHFDAIAAQARAEALAGSHVPREEVAKAAFGVARQVRDCLLLIEERLPDQLASITDPARIREMLHREFRAALNKLSTEVAADDQSSAA